MTEETAAPQAEPDEPAPQLPIEFFPGGEVNAALQWAMERIRDEANGKLDIDGRQYTTVAKRVEIFRRAFGPTARIVTDLDVSDPDVVRACAVVSIHFDGSVRVVANGHAEEWRDANDFNRFSAAENAETSAIGRALASLGLHGGEFATADEVAAAREEAATAIKNQTAALTTQEEVSSINARLKECLNLEALQVVWAGTPPVLKQLCSAVYRAQYEALSSAPSSGSETERTGSQRPASGRQPASPQRRGRSSGGA